MTAPNVNLFIARMIVDRLCDHGLRRVVISPGSRSAPLAVAATDRAGVDFRMILDERAAGYYVSGAARATGTPVGIICTSGTAVVNLFPAVVEAHQSRLPLVLLTADRPEELQDCGANQTIDQQNIFGRYATGITIAAPDETTDPARILDDLDRAMAAISDGPVHINIRFREPLAPVEQPYDHGRMTAAVAARRSNHDCRTVVDQTDDLSRTVDDLVSALKRSRRGLIVAGPETPFRASAKIGELARRLGRPLVCDILSQQRGREGGNRCVAHDLYLDAPGRADDVSCDLILHVGGLPTSKRLNEFLVRLKGIPYIKIQDHGRTVDPDRLETERHIASVDRVLDRLLDRLEPRGDGELRTSWSRLERQAAQTAAEWFADGRLTEPAAAFHLGRLIGDGEALFLSNSMPVRQAESFMDLAGRDIMVGCNRGTSGIDGVVASACGFAAAAGRPTTLLIGDLALLHDLNSLAAAADNPVPVVVVVINNHGGGIFDFLPVARFPELLARCFTAGHRFTFAAAAAMFGLPYYRPSLAAELTVACRSARQTGRSSLVEIAVDREETVGEQDQIRRAVQNALREVKE